MYTIEEFKGKTHIILDKSLWTFVMNRQKEPVDLKEHPWLKDMYPDGYRNIWHVYSISRNLWYHDMDIMDDDEAYEFYKERMESFGFKPFKVYAD